MLFWGRVTLRRGDSAEGVWAVARQSPTGIPELGKSLPHFRHEFAGIQDGAQTPYGGSMSFESSQNI